MMKFNQSSRRIFLKQISGLFLSSLVVSPEIVFGRGKNNQKDIFFIGKTEHYHPFNPIKDGIKYYVAHLNWETNTLTNIPIDFRGHGIQFIPHRPNILYLTQKYGPNACLVNWKQKLVTNSIELDDDRLFGGHSVVGRNKKILYTCEYLKGGAGVITLRDCNSLKKINEYSTFGRRPHQVELLDNENIIVVPNQKPSPETSNLCYIDAHSGKLLEKLTCPTALYMGLSHFDIQNDTILFGGTNRKKDDSHIVFRKGSGPLESLGIPSNSPFKMKDEILNVCLNKKGTIGCSSNNMDNIVCFWDLEHKKFLKAYDIHIPRGIYLSHDEKYFLVLYEYGVLAFDSKTFEKRKIASYEHTFERHYTPTSHVFYKSL